MGKNIIDGQEFIYNDEYSHKDFTGRKLLNAKDLNGITIFGSCFSHEIPGTKVFPDDMKDVTFINCNLDNVYIPAGNQTIGCSQRKFKVQNDLMDWILDEDLKPKEPIMKKEFEKLGISIDPKDIPKDKMDESIIEQKLKIIEKYVGDLSNPPEII